MESRFLGLGSGGVDDADDDKELRLASSLRMYSA